MSPFRLVDMVHTLIIANARPARPPFLIYFMLMAGLIVLLDAYRDPANHKLKPHHEFLRTPRPQRETVPSYL